MPIDSAAKMKSKRLAMLRRMRGTGYSEVDQQRDELDQEGLLPPKLRSRLYTLFNQVEREFENIYAENLALHEKIEILNEKLELATGGEKYEGADTSDAGAAAWKAGVKKWN